jgi:predicted DNA-binding protein (MmcQ/YjbR family)
MDIKEFETLAAALPGTDLSQPFGPGTQVWKVGGKMFAAYGDIAEGVTLKCRDVETAAMLMEVGAAQKARYLTRGGWVRFGWGDETLPDRLRDSYDAVAKGLTKAQRAALAG